MSVVSFIRLASTGSVRAALFINPETVLASIANDLRVFRRNESSGGWVEVARHPFSPYGGTATGLSLCKTNNHFLICAYGIRKIRFFELSVFQTKFECKFRSVTECYNVDDLVLDVKTFPLKSEIINNLAVWDDYRFGVLVGLAHNYIDLFELSLLSFKPVIRIQCSIQSLLYSLDIFINREITNQNFITIEVASGTVDSRILLWGFDIPSNHLSHTTFPFSLSSQRSSIFTLSPVFSTSILPYESLQSHRGVIFKLRYILDGEYLLSTSDDREISLWQRLGQNQASDESKTTSLGNQRMILQCSMKGHRARVWDACLVQINQIKNKLIRQSNAIVSAGEDSECLVWTFDGILLHRLLGHTGRGVRTMASIPSTSMFLSCGEDGDIKVWCLNAVLQQEEMVKNQNVNNRSKEQSINCGDDGVLKFDIKQIDHKDWIRDVHLLSHSLGLFISNFGGLGIFVIQKTEQKNKVDSDCVENNQFEYNLIGGSSYGSQIVIKSFRRYPEYLFTTLAASTSIRNEISNNEDNPMIVIGTADGDCLAFSNLIFRHDECRHVKWKVFENCRIQKIFVYQIPSIGSSFLIVVTNHTGAMKLYISHQLNNKSFVPVPIGELYQLKCYRKESRIFSAGCFIKQINKRENHKTQQINKRENHKTLLFDYECFLCLGDEHGDLHPVNVNFTIQEEKEEKEENEENKGNEENHVFDCKVDLKPKYQNLHQREKIFSIIINTEDNGISTKIKNIITTGGDGTIRLCNEQMQLISTIKNAKFKVMWSLLYSKDNSFNNSNDILHDDYLIAGFKGADFVVWNSKASAEIWRFCCGGPRRPFSLFLSSDGMLSSSSVTGSHLYIRSHNTVGSIIENTDNLVKPCESMIGGFHGREIWSVGWISEEVLITASEDNSLKLLKIDETEENKNGFQILRCLETYSDHPASIRTVKLVDVKINRNKIKFIVSAGARQIINIYYYDNNHLNNLYRHSLNVYNDERIMTLSITAIPFDNMNDNLISLHIFVGTSSGQLIHLSLLLRLSFTDLSILQSVSISSFTSCLPVPCCKLSEYASQFNSDWIRSDQIDRLPTSILSSELIIQPINNNYIIILAVGCTVGMIRLYTLFLSGLPCFLPLSLIGFAYYRSHQVGTNSIQLASSSEPINQAPDLSSITTSLTNSIGIPELPRLFSSSVTRPPLYSIEDSTVINNLLVMVLSCGDDNSLTAQNVLINGTPNQLYLSLLGLSRAPRAHSSSARGLVCYFPYLFSVGWDRLLRIWLIDFFNHQYNHESKITNPSTSVNQPFDCSITSMCSLSNSTAPMIRFIAAIPVAVPDVSGIAIQNRFDASNINQQSKNQSLLRLAIVGGASGVDILDVLMSPI